MVSVSLLHFLANDHIVAFGENFEDVVRTPTLTKYITLALLSSIFCSQRGLAQGFAHSIGRWVVSEYQRVYPRTTVLNVNLVVIVILNTMF